MTFPTSSTLALLASVALSFPALADCSGQPALRTKPIVDSFLIRPASLLDLYPFGSIAMSALIRDLVAAAPDKTLKPVLQLLKQANRYQEQSIGLGIGLAARLCDRAQQPWKAKELRQQPALNDDEVAMAAFTLAYRGEAPDLSAAPTTPDRPTDPLGRGFIGSPDIDAFKQTKKLPDPLAPIQ